MSSCCCSLAGTAACRTCSNNPFAETPPPVRTYTVSATDPVLITGQKTNGERIRGMSDEELADFVNDAEYGFLDRPGMCDVCYHHRMKDCLACWLTWLKSPVEQEVDNGT